MKLAPAIARSARAALAACVLVVGCQQSSEVTDAGAPGPEAGSADLTATVDAGADLLPGRDAADLAVPRDAGVTVDAAVDGGSDLAPAPDLALDFQMPDLAQAALCVVDDPDSLLDDCVISP